MNKQRKQQAVAGLAIVGLGLTLWALQSFVGLNMTSAMFVVSGLLLAFYFYQREVGLLIPAAILGGVAAGNLHGNYRPMYIGLGFFAITVIALVYQRKFIGWPLIPGTVLVLFRLRQTEIFTYLRNNWPVVLIAVGVLIVIVALLRRDTPDRPSQGSG